MEHFNNFSEDVITRILKEAHYMVDELATVRATAKYIGYCKSVVFKDLTKKLPLIDAELYEEVRIVLDLNREERAYRGGNALKSKFKKG